ncbi:MAG TPA: YihY/virulence factor BrkB family protein [Vicinamibacterales bacterium]|nr:YihY/virulence factor BrkB family protein [Vicinamibacterales bacterium]
MSFQNIWNHVFAFAVMGMAGVLLIGAFALFAVVRWLSGIFGNAAIAHGPTDSIFALLGSFIVFTVTFALLFKFLFPVPLRWRHVWLAALLCATAWIVFTEMLGLYGAYFGSLSIPGALGALLAITVWLNLVSQVVFYGAELCKVVASRERRSLRGPDSRAYEFSRSAVSIWRRRTPSR